MLLGLVQSGVLQPISARDVRMHVMRGRSLGVANLRFLPKLSSLRPIVNFSCKSTCGPGEPLSEGRTVNRQLETTLKILQLETVRHWVKVAG